MFDLMDCKIKKIIKISVMSALVFGLAGCKKDVVISSEPVIPLIDRSKEAKTEDDLAKENDIFNGIHVEGIRDVKHGNVKEILCEDLSDADVDKLNTRASIAAQYDDMIAEIRKSDSKSSPKVTSVEIPKETAKAASKDTLKETTKAASKDTTKETAKAASKDTTKETTKAAGKDTLKETAKAASKDTTKETAKATIPDFVQKKDEEVIVESIQLSGEQLEKISALLNLKEKNPYLQEEYSLPSEVELDGNEKYVEITCVAGTYDSNNLYSVFYKKKGDNSLWNVVMRSSKGEYIFHSNSKCSNK